MFALAKGLFGGSSLYALYGLARKYNDDATATYTQTVQGNMQLNYMQLKY